MSETPLSKKIIIFTSFFISGSIGAVIVDILYNTESIGLHNVEKKFRKPLFQNVLMFIGMSLCIFNTPFFMSFTCKNVGNRHNTNGWQLFRMISLPALFDLGSTSLQSIALLYLEPSVWQITRGSIMLFTALFAFFYRRQKFYAHNWIGVFVSFFGVCIVGLSSILSGKKEESSSKKDVRMKILALILVLIAQALQALQTVIEEKLFVDIDATEYELVSYEGIWGLYLTLSIVLPLANILPEDLGEGLYENTLESLLMMLRNYRVFLLALCYICSSYVFNISGMYLMSISSAVHRNIYEALKSAGVWLLSVIVYYAFPSLGAGEKFSLLSLVQLLGFAVSTFGSFIYNGSVSMPCFKRRSGTKVPI